MLLCYSLYSCNIYFAAVCINSSLFHSLKNVRLCFVVNLSFDKNTLFVQHYIPCMFKQREVTHNSFSKTSFR